MALVYPCKITRTTFGKNTLRFKIYSFISNIWRDQIMMFFNIDQSVIFCLFILKLFSEASSPYEKSYACIQCTYTEVSGIERKPCESSYGNKACSGTLTVHFAWTLGGRGNLFPSNFCHTTDIPTNVA